MKQDLYMETPLIYSHPISNILGSNVYLKLENLQPSGSFKNRGIGHFCKMKVKSGAKEFVSSSGGNAGLAAAFASSQLGTPITVVVPTSTCELMVDRIKSHQATVIQEGDDWQEADKIARSLCKTRGGCYVPPFDDPFIWTGNATLVHEIADAGLHPDAVVLSVGGGGLFCGVAQGMHDVGWKNVPIYAVETEGAASFAASLKAGHIVEIEKIDTIAKSLGARTVTEQAIQIARSHPICSKVVSDTATSNACCHFAEDHRMLVEPACGASLSLCYDKDVALKGHKNIVVIVCGGAAVTPKMLLH